MTDYSYCEASDVQAELRTTTAFSSSTTPTLTTCEQWISEASAEINRLSGDVFGATTYIQEFDLDGQCVIQTRHSPIISVTSLLYNQNPLGSSSGTSYLAMTEDTHFTVYKDTGEIVWLPNFSPVDGRKRVKVTYKGGYLEVPAYIQTLCVKMVAERVLSSLLNSNVNEGSDGGSISVGSISIVEPGAYGVQNFRRLQNDVAESKKALAVGTGVYRY